MNNNKRSAQRPSTGIGINLTIVVFNIALIAALWVVILTVTRADHKETVDAVIDRNNNLAIALEEYTKRTIESADSVLRYMIREYSRVGGKIDLDKFVQNFTISSSVFVGVVLADENGNISTTAYLRKPAKPVNVADREHFKVHVAQDTQAVFVGKPVTGRVTGKEVVPITRRIDKPDGSFGGVMMVLIDYRYFTNMLQDAKMRPFDVFSVVGLDGITRSRLRGAVSGTGEDISKSPLFTEQAKRPDGNFFTKGQLDGVPKFFSYRTLPKYRLMTIVGSAEADVLADFNHRQRQYFWSAGLASALIAWFTVLLILMLTRQRRAAAIVARGQARFLATFNQAAVGIAHSDLDGVCLDANQKLCDIIGYRREELLGRKFTALTHPDDVAASDDFRSQMLARPDEFTSLQREKRYIHKNGSIVWCLLTTTVVRDDAGNIDYLAAIVQDISALKATEQSLKMLEQEQRLLAQQTEVERARLAEAQALARIGSWETRLPELTVAWSAETYRIFEVDADRFQPTHAVFLEFIHADDRAKVDAAFSSSLEDQSRHSIEHRIVLRNGRIKTVEERWRTFHDDQGQPVRVAGTCQDITDKKKAEQDHAQLAAIVESSNDAIISRSLDDVIVSWNKAAERMFGWTAAEAIGRPPQIIKPPDHLDKFTHILERVKLGETSEPFETVRVRKNGVRFDAQVSLSAVKDNSNQVIGIAMTVRDITERREKEAIVQKEKLFSDTMLESMPGIVYFYTEQGRFLRWNQNFARVSGYSPDEIARMHPLDFIASTDKILVEKKIREVFTQGEATVEAAFLMKNGRTVEYFFTGRRVIFDGAVCLVGMGIDIHARRLAEATLRDYAAEMRHLSWRLSEVEERERRNIQRELHDQVGANLAALKLDLGLINTMLTADAPKIVGDRLKKAQQLTGETITKIRNVMADLRPPALDDYGLLAALRNYAQGYSARLGIPVMVDGDDIQPRPVIAVETALFRIAQEALSNIAKHAQARHAGITVTVTDDSVTLVVADDGAGFDAGHPDPHHAAWGLRTMRERAQAIAAAFRVESSSGKGTRVIVELPRERT